MAATWLTLSFVLGWFAAPRDHVAMAPTLRFANSIDGIDVLPFYEALGFQPAGGAMRRNYGRRLGV